MQLYKTNNSSKSLSCQKHVEFVTAVNTCRWFYTSPPWAYTHPIVRVRPLNIRTINAPVLLHQLYRDIKCILLDNTCAFFSCRIFFTNFRTLWAEQKNVLRFNHIHLWLIAKKVSKQKFFSIITGLQFIRGSTTITFRV